MGSSAAVGKGHGGSGRKEYLRSGEGSEGTEKGKNGAYLRVGGHPGLT